MEAVRQTQTSLGSQWGQIATSPNALQEYTQAMSQSRAPVDPTQDMTAAQQRLLALMTDAEKIDFMYNNRIPDRLLNEGTGGYKYPYPEGAHIESMGGYDVLVDATGRVVDFLGKTPTTGASEYEQQSLEMRQRELEAEQAWRQQQLQAEKEQRLASLAAQPKSWLEYASLSGQAPVVQPWMQPLMPSDYAVGSTIPGWSASNMGQMPGLTTPSTQYTARMGPTAQQQYMGYQQARTGATPEETQFRLWSMAPPSGRNRGLTQVR